MKRTQQRTKEDGLGRSALVMLLVLASALIIAWRFRPTQQSDNLYQTASVARQPPSKVKPRNDFEYQVWPEQSPVPGDAKTIISDFPGTHRTELPAELKEDDVSPETYANVVSNYAKDPGRALELMKQGFQAASAAKGFWANLIGYTYLNDFKNELEALNWLEVAVRHKTSDLNVTDTLVAFYSQPEYKHRGYKFLSQFEDEKLTTLIEAKLLIQQNQPEKGVALLRSLLPTDLDDGSRNFLERYEKIENL